MHTTELLAEFVEFVEDSLIVDTRGATYGFK